MDWLDLLAERQRTIFKEPLVFSVIVKLKPFTTVWDLNPCAGTWTRPKPSLGLKPMWMGFKPSQNPAWDLNPHGWDSNPAWTHGTLFQDLMKLRFLMFHCRKNSVRDKVIGKKWIYSLTERSTLHKQSADHSRGRVWPQNMVWLVFIDRVISYAIEWEAYSNCFWKGAGISRVWATTHSLVF